MTPVVVDSSVAIKWFVPENLSDPAQRLLGGSFTLLAPDLILPECGNVLWKKLARGELAVSEASAVMQGLVRAPLRVFASAGLVEAALEVATAYRTTVYDGMYVALAVAQGCILITADDRLARALSEGPLTQTVQSLAQWDSTGSGLGGG